MPTYKGVSRQHEVRASQRRKDTRRSGVKLKEFLQSSEGGIVGASMIALFALVMVVARVPFGGELALFMAFLYRRSEYARPEKRAFDFPFRVPKIADLKDGSIPGGQKKGAGITLLGNDNETKEQVYSTDSDLRTHMLVLGTTGSGKPQPYHARILTPKGWMRMEQAEEGGIVCTPDGKQARILRVIEQGEQEVFTVRAKNGRWAQGTGDHLWRVLVRDRAGSESAQTVTTDAIGALLEKGARVMLPQVRRRKGGGAKFERWTRIWKVEHAGRYLCRCIEIDHPQHLYITDNNLVTHNTEFLLGLVFNALVQNTGFIYVDGKGDPKLQKEIFRLARYLGREDDLLIINFITSGRDFVEKQADKVTNNMNIMGNTSSGMLIELIVALMDDSGGGGDMWKGRAISFVAALTRPLTYLRDKGYINLSPEKYLEYFELNMLEELVFEHNGKYGEMFDVIVAPLRSYLLTLPGYQKSKLKKQEQKTLEQHGFIVMQLTRIFNDLNFNYGHIFKTRVGDVDFFDVVVRRRLLTVLLPALERAPDSLRMLGKMIVGSIKQMMAGCLGNRVEGVIREIIESRPTNAEFPFYCILDEYGYYAVIGFAVAPAQARSLGFSVTFAAQDFSSLKKSSAEEADATWENTNVRAVGRITSGQESETWRRINGAAAEAGSALVDGYDRGMGMTSETFRSRDSISIKDGSRLNYDDLAMQENGEFTFIIGKKENKGLSGGVRVIRGMGFYTAGPTPREMRINDFIPVETPEPADLPRNRQAYEALRRALLEGTFATTLKSAVKGDPILSGMHVLLESNHINPSKPKLNRTDVARAALGWYLDGQPALARAPAGTGSSGGVSPEPRPEEAGSGEEVQAEALDATTANAYRALDMVAEEIRERTAAGLSPLPLAAEPRTEPPVYISAEPLPDAEDDEAITVRTDTVTTNLLLTEDDSTAFNQRALPMLKQFMLQIDAEPGENWDQQLSVADREKLLEMEVVSRGQRFGSLAEKWETGDRIDELRSQIAKETSYIAPPVPDKASVEDVNDELTKLIGWIEESRGQDDFSTM
ncbi:MAG: TraM recognition domain-containing protein [Rhodanobacter sp.]|jgi:intracellular multiplication protein IcmO